MQAVSKWEKSTAYPDIEKMLFSLQNAAMLRLLLIYQNRGLKKSFITRKPDKERDEEKRYPWRFKEWLGYYYDWLFHTCREEVFDCNSGDKPHKHCMDTLIVQKIV